MNATESYALAHKIIKKCDGSRDPEVIYQCLGIELEDSFDLIHLKGCILPQTGTAQSIYISGWKATFENLC